MICWVGFSRAFVSVNKLEKYRPKEAKTIYHQLKGGFEDRAIQVKELEKWIEESPYPVMVCGDLNELPYGFAYGKIRKYLRNSFEDAGRGFGFTYHRKPGFLRIDNQFYDEKKTRSKTIQNFFNI